MNTTKGRRVYGKAPHELEAGDYGRWDQDSGSWHGCVPGGTDLVARLTRHSVTEHEDGTVTVMPSILVSGAPGEQWHGFLERGVWREC